MRLARVWVSLLVIPGAICALLGTPASALETTPSVPPKIDGSLLITGYAFQGNSLQYLQVANVGDDVADLDGWRLVTTWSGGSWTYDGPDLSGLVLPGNKITIASHAAVSSATFTYTTPGTPTSDRLTSIRLIAPASSNWNDSTITISTTDTGSSPTPRVATSPPTFYFARNTSSSTGAFLSTFTAFVPGSSFTLQSDALYEPPDSTSLRIVEIYAKPSSCSPSSSGELCEEYIKLYNPSGASINLGQFRLRSGSFGQSSSSSNTAELAAGLLPPHTYVAYPLGLVDSGAWVWIEDAYGLVRYDPTVESYPSFSSQAGMAWSLNDTTNAWQWTEFPTPYDIENAFSQGGVINYCEGLRLSEIAANYSPQFIEVHNQSDTSLDISGCQIRTNRSDTAKFVFPDGTLLEGGAYQVIPISGTDLALTKTTSGTVYLLSSDGSVEIDAKSYEDLDEGTSLAQVGGTWKQTFAVTLGVGNEYLEYPECDDGYVRNVETGRCNKITAAQVLKACLSTQYRNPETNRCRNLASVTASTLKPCAANQYRSAETNRCRLIANAASELKPCSAGQERNPETNRCRNLLAGAVPTADFPVEATGASDNQSLGWAAFLGVGVLALGYAGWEWRYEIAEMFRKLKGLVLKQ